MAEGFGITMADDRLVEIVGEGRRVFPQRRNRAWLEWAGQTLMLEAWQEVEDEKRKEEEERVAENRRRAEEDRRMAEERRVAEEQRVEEERRKKVEEEKRVQEERERQRDGLRSVEITRLRDLLRSRTIDGKAFAESMQRVDEVVARQMGETEEEEEVANEVGDGGKRKATGAEVEEMEEVGGRALRKRSRAMVLVPASDDEGEEEVDELESANEWSGTAKENAGIQRGKRATAGRMTKALRPVSGPVKFLFLSFKKLVLIGFVFKVR
jgi:unconventional prefoldin RPB5 interactor 1